MAGRAVRSANSEIPDLDNGLWERVQDAVAAESGSAVSLWSGQLNYTDNPEYRGAAYSDGKIELNRTLVVEPLQQMYATRGQPATAEQWSIRRNALKTVAHEFDHLAGPDGFTHDRWLNDLKPLEYRPLEEGVTEAWSQARLDAIADRTLPPDLAAQVKAVRSPHSYPGYEPAARAFADQVGAEANLSGNEVLRRMASQPPMSKARAAADVLFDSSDLPTLVPAAEQEAVRERLAAQINQDFGKLQSLNESTAPNLRAISHSRGMDIADSVTATVRATETQYRNQLGLQQTQQLQQATTREHPTIEFRRPHPQQQTAQPQQQPQPVQPQQQPGQQAARPQPQFPKLQPIPPRPQQPPQQPPQQQPQQQAQYAQPQQPQQPAYPQPPQPPGQQQSQGQWWQQPQPQQPQAPGQQQAPGQWQQPQHPQRQQQAQGQWWPQTQPQSPQQQPVYPQQLQQTPGQQQVPGQPHPQPQHPQPWYAQPTQQPQHQQQNPYQQPPRQPSPQQPVYPQQQQQPQYQQQQPQYQQPPGQQSSQQQAQYQQPGQVHQQPQQAQPQYPQPWYAQPTQQQPQHQQQNPYQQPPGQQSPQQQQPQQQSGQGQWWGRQVQGGGPRSQTHQQSGQSGAAPGQDVAALRAVLDPQAPAAGATRMRPGQAASGRRGGAHTTEQSAGRTTDAPSR